MQTQNSDSLSSSTTISSLTEVTESKLQSPKLNNPSPSVTTRLWRPAAQRNVRNQWSKLVSQKHQWSKASSSGRSHLASLVNSYLSQRYMPAMDLGALSDMANIRQRACQKLAQQQELHGASLLSSYKDMVVVVSHMTNISSSMRCFVKGPAGSPLVQFSSHSEDKNDLGDGGGISVFTFWSIPYFENLAKELVQMFASELMLKRLLVVKLLTISCEEGPRETEKLRWSDELYPGEYEDLGSCQLFSEENCQPIPPKTDSPAALDIQSDKQLNPGVLQVYLTAWLVEYNINMQRVNDIFKIVGEEMHVSLS